MPFDAGSTISNNEFEKLIRNKFQSQNWGTIFKIELWDDSWQFEKNYLGVVEYRYFKSAIAFQNTNGDCIYDVYKISQQFDGVNYKNDIDWEWVSDGRQEEIKVPAFFIRN